MNFLTPGLLRANGRSIAIFALGWVVVITGTVAFLAHSQGRTRESEGQRFEARADIAARFVATYVGDLVARQGDIARRRLSGDRVSRRVFETTTADSGYGGAVLLDARGRVLQSTRSMARLIGTRIAPKYPHLTAAVAGRVGISPVVLSAAPNIPIVAFAVPFDTGSGRRVYSGGYDVSRTPLGAYLRNAMPIAGTRLYLVDKSGQIVAWNGARNSRIQTLGQIEGEAAVAVGGASAGDYDSADGRRRFVARKVAGTPWRIVVTASEARLQPSVHGVGWWLPWLAVLGFAIVGLVVGFLLLRLLVGREGLLASRTELAATVATLSERKQMLKGIIDNGTALIFVKGLDGRYLLYNQAFADAFDLDERGGVEGKTGLEILLGRDDTWLAPELASARRANDLEATRGPQQVEEWSDHPVRGRISYDSIRFPLHDHEDRLYATCGISLDVSERLQVTERLREAEEHFRGAFDEAPIGIGLVGLDGRWTRVNQALCDFTGYTRDEFLTMTVEDITHREDLLESRRSLKAVVSGENSGYQLEKRYRHADGHPIWALLSVSLGAMPPGSRCTSSARSRTSTNASMRRASWRSRATTRSRRRGSSRSSWRP